MTTRKQMLFTLPVCSTDFGLQAYWDGRGSRPAIRFGFRSDAYKVLGSIEFSTVLATRHRTESCSTAWHIEECFDKIVEVEGSQWLKDIVSAIPKHLAGERIAEHKHLMIYLDSSGCFEIIAKAFEYTEERISDNAEQVKTNIDSGI